MTRAVSHPFVTSREFAGALDGVREHDGPLRMERSNPARRGDWIDMGVMSAAEAKRRVRSLDGSPRPGRFRLAKGD